MPLYRDALPQLDRVFLTDGGLETSLVFLQGLDLPCFAAFPLALHESGREALTRYFQPFIELAKERRMGLVLDAPTWRANPDWGARLGYDAEALRRANLAGVSYVADLRAKHASPTTPIVLNGVVGPRGDGYQVGRAMPAEEAEEYHRAQILTFRDSEADMVSAITMTYSDEAIGIVRAARACGMPVVVSFTVETDGRLPSGEDLRSAIEATDRVSDAYPSYYMINCAHPRHFAAVLGPAGSWLDRIRGLRANASTRSHAELDEATELDIGDPAELGSHYCALGKQLTRLCVLGGCCGTDQRHVAAICEACL